jgi:hypothetical protein
MAIAFLDEILKGDRSFMGYNLSMFLLYFAASGSDLVVVVMA